MRRGHIRRWQIWVAVPLIIIIGVSLLVGLAPRQPVARQNVATKPVPIREDYFADSNYRQVKSHVKKTDNQHIDSFVEYPVTKNVAVNQVVSQAVSAMHRKFLLAVQGRTPLAGRKFTEKVSYNVTFADKHYLSLVVNGKYDTESLRPYNVSRYWTFDMVQGSVISLANLVGGSQDGTRAMLGAIQKAIAAKIGGKLVFDKNITAANIPSFALQDKSTLILYFNRGEVAFPSAGSFYVTISISKKLAPYLHNKVATAIFDVPKPPPPPAVKAHAACSHKKIRCIALSFDDGPGPYTDKLLGILKKYHIKATFFLIGRQVDRYSAQVKHEAAADEAIGNHTWDHKDLTKLSEKQRRSQIVRTSEAIKKITGKNPTMLRPPYGATNHALQETTKKLGMSSVFWSVDTRDWADHNSKIVCNRAVANAHPGSIILLHDIHPTSVAAVPCIIKGLESHGYRLVTVPQLLGKMQPGENYYRAE